MRACLAAVVSVLVAAPSVASAQTFTNPVRNGSPRANDPGAGGTVSPTLPIGLRDCPNENWTFTVTYTASSALTSLSYWIGVDGMACSAATTRYPVATGSARCWHIGQSGLDRASPPSSGSYQIVVPSRYLVDPLNGDCTAPSTTQGVTGTNYLSLLGFPPSDANLVGTALGIPYDVHLPDAPGSVTGAPGENSAVISWQYAGNSLDVSEGGTAAPTDLQGFWLLCDHDPIPVDGGTADGGTTDAGFDGGTATVDAGVTDGAVDVGTVTGPSCGTAAFLNVDPNNDAQFNQYLCPNQSTLIGASSTSATATGLTNFVAYRFAVVAQNAAGNRSTLAITTNCVTPVPVTSFWDHYRAENGGALPGYCSARPWGTEGTPRAPWAVLGLLGLTLGVRRARRTGSPR